MTMSLYCFLHPLVQKRCTRIEAVSIDLPLLY
jgi:hypothetical protein